MQREFTIREMIDEDVSRVKEIETSAALSGWNHEGYTKSVIDETAIKIVSLLSSGGTERIVGFVIGKFVGHEVSEIYNIAVDQDFRRRGIGEYLIKAFLEESSVYGVKKVWLEVRETNRSIVCFYESFGFHVKYSRPKFYSNPTEDALVMCLEPT